MLDAAGNGCPGASAQDKTRKDMAGPFGIAGPAGSTTLATEHAECFVCKRARGNAKINKTSSRTAYKKVPMVLPINTPDHHQTAIASGEKTVVHCFFGIALVSAC
eukprot:2995256-Amphidinium_carterae.1